MHYLGNPCQCLIYQGSQRSLIRRSELGECLEVVEQRLVGLQQQQS